MKNIIYKILGLVVICVSVLIAWMLMEYQQFTSEKINTSEDGYRYEIKSGTNLKSVARDLSQASLIGNSRTLVWVARLTGNANHIKKGEYLFTGEMTAEDVLKKITKGETIQYAVTIIEGWSFSQLRTALEKNKNLVQTINGFSDAKIMSKLGMLGEHPEGQFLPDTYKFPRGTSDLEFLKRAANAMSKFVQQAWEDRDPGLPYKKPYQAMIMASIVEKETGLPSERAQIAGVFVRRLQKRMRLQTDPTVIYGLGKAYKGNIKRRHLKMDTPYNTYTRYGLPPTPIAMPGADAIEAALHPAEGESLYFVSRGDGSHKFTSNLKDHNNAVIKYQLKGKRKNFSSMKVRKSKASK